MIVIFIGSLIPHFFQGQTPQRRWFELLMSSWVLWGQEVDFSREAGTSASKSNISRIPQKPITQYDTSANSGQCPFTMVGLWSSTILYLSRKLCLYLTCKFTWSLPITYLFVYWYTSFPAVSLEDKMYILLSSRSQIFERASDWTHFYIVLKMVCIIQAK